MKLTLTNPDEIKFRMEVEMTLREWKKLREQLQSVIMHPGATFWGEINSMIQQAEKTFYPEK